MADKSRTLSLKQRGLTFEMLMWIFTRLSALAMYGFFLVGLVGAFWMGARYHMNFADVMRWAFTTNYIHVQSTNVPLIDPWASAFWRLVASGLFLVATAHGVHGLVVIADDYIVSPGGRKFVRLLSMIAMASMSLIGVYVLWTY
jgi:succinate dehydrogenase hydrophobic anchor subunit